VSVPDVPAAAAGPAVPAVPTGPAGTGPGLTYRAAGVDIAAGERAVELLRPKVAGATRPEVVGGLGGFSGLFALDTGRWRRPLLASATDGVGTKLLIAQSLDRHDTVGIDLVAMVADDLVVCGAEPLFLLDYLSCGRLVPERVAQIVGGVAKGCRQAGCALVGGETAEHPGVLGDDEYDLAGAGVGIVEADAVLGPERVRAGDVVVAMASSGLHSNGYSLARKVLLGPAGFALTDEVAELGRTLGEELLQPTRIYALDCLALIAGTQVHALAHITGGGLPGNLARVLPAALDAVIDRGTWTPPPVFGLIQRLGGVERAEMEATFNLGVGMVAVVAADAADTALHLLGERGVAAWVAGAVTAGSGASGALGGVRLVGGPG
jgi:phosphoribosylformylglycinamidine cyclo-ligase